MKTIITHPTRYVAMMFALVASLILNPTTTNASENFEVSGWIPYWTSSAPKAAEKRLRDIDMIHPFGYSIKSDGTLLDNMNIGKGDWKKLITAARKKDVTIVPTVTTSNGTLVHTLLSDPQKREEHIDAIVSVVKKGKFDGIDINYEGKLSITHDAFGDFLEELKDELGKKILSCTIEARTPPDSLYRTIPDTIAYANNFDAINEHCDRINIMAYDQQRADIKLNDARLGEPYIPVSDAAWVRKVLEFTLPSLDADKVVLGIPSYGHEYEVLVLPQQFAEYRRVNAYNIPLIEKKMKDKKVVEGRSASGEPAFTYLGLGKHAPQYGASAPKGTKKHLEAAAKSLAYTNATNIPTVFNYVTWSDADAMIEKIDLAREFNLLGVVFFKIDGQEDKDVWKELR
jgi:spore germination protein YaaH